LFHRVPPVSVPHDIGEKVRCIKRYVLAES
jgi:hypothetical protein